MVTVGGADTRMTRRKDTEHSKIWMETDTSANSGMISDTAMEYPDLYISPQYITESTKRAREKGTDITDRKIKW